jgi:hypothetical protein
VHNGVWIWILFSFRAYKLPLQWWVDPAMFELQYQEHCGPNGNPLYYDCQLKTKELLRRLFTDNKKTLYLKTQTEEWYQLDVKYQPSHICFVCTPTKQPNETLSSLEFSSNQLNFTLRPLLNQIIKAETDVKENYDKTAAQSHTTEHSPENCTPPLPENQRLHQEKVPLGRLTIT